MRIFLFGIFAGVFLTIGIPLAQAAEGGYSNYIPGTYGDFAAAVEPPEKLTIRNDIYYYKADEKKSIPQFRFVFIALFWA